MVPTQGSLCADLLSFAECSVAAWIKFRKCGTATQDCQLKLAKSFQCSCRQDKRAERELTNEGKATIAHITAVVKGNYTKTRFTEKKIEETEKIRLTVLLRSSKPKKRGALQRFIARHRDLLALGFDLGILYSDTCVPTGKMVANERAPSPCC